MGRRNRLNQFIRLMLSLRRRRRGADLRCGRVLSSAIPTAMPDQRGNHHRMGQKVCRGGRGLVKPIRLTASLVSAIKVSNRRRNMKREVAAEIVDSLKEAGVDFVEP